MKSQSLLSAFILVVLLTGCSDWEYNELQSVEGRKDLAPAPSVDLIGNGKNILAGPKASAPLLLGDWKTIVVDPYTVVTPKENAPSATDIAELAIMLKKSIEEQGLETRGKNDIDNRWISLSFHVVNSGMDHPFIVKLSQIEIVRIEREGGVIVGPAVTWQIEGTFFMKWGLSSQRKVIEEAMDTMAKRFADAINEGRASRGR